MALVLLLTALFTFALTATASMSPKRGLCHIHSPEHPHDDQIWASSRLTWYYNYQASPSPFFDNHKTLEFVPMMWGAPPPKPPSPDEHAQKPLFLDSIKAQLSLGANITHVLSFNEPDGPFGAGGSNLRPHDAMKIWKSQIEPLRDLGIKVGAPAVTGTPAGIKWLEAWLKECDYKCHFDFVPVHWYGDFQGLADRLGHFNAKFPRLPIWVTEFGLREAGLEETQRMVQESLKLLDRWSAVERYAYFGAFRSDVSNIGPNAAMLTEKGLLTDIGSWYMGGEATHRIPHTNSAPLRVQSARTQIVLAAFVMAVCLVHA